MAHSEAEVELECLRKKVKEQEIVSTPSFFLTNSFNHLVTAAARVTSRLLRCRRPIADMPNLP